ncbi:hypothetical protein IX329_001019 [Fusobacterium necrophorum]|nr:hypothetical protein [Fusobacterium necrophorum]MBR8733445.1 hypothetical protein [Fusobacterium necrophorum]MBR8789622.1 hypothetical protein [Fusobacterium necrophorum]
MKIILFERQKERIERIKKKIYESQNIVKDIYDDRKRKYFDIIKQIPFPAVFAGIIGAVLSCFNKLYFYIYYPVVLFLLFYLLDIRNSVLEKKKETGNKLVVLALQILVIFLLSRLFITFCIKIWRFSQWM